MKYNDAKQWIESNKQIKGTRDSKGFVITDLFIVPSEPKDRDVFLQNYLYSEDKSSAIKPYIDNDVQVWSVDLGRLESDNILFYNVLAK